jgi:hypothetical protein
LNNQNENLKKVDYTINEDKNKTVTINSGKFSGTKILFSKFDSVYDNNEKAYMISYDYQIVNGDVGIDEGAEIKGLMRNIINDIIEGYTNKEE